MEDIFADRISCKWISYQRVRMAEGVGFEPTTLSGNGFQDRRLRPLGHPSVKFALQILQSILKMDPWESD
jgi:hypothetical protein